MVWWVGWNSNHERRYPVQDWLVAPVGIPADGTATGSHIHQWQRNTKVLDLVSKGNMDDVETFLSEVRNLSSLFQFSLLYFSGLFHVVPQWVQSVVSFRLLWTEIQSDEFSLCSIWCKGNPLIQRLSRWALAFPGVEQAACHQGADLKLMLNQGFLSAQRAFSWNLHQPSSPRNGGCERGKLEQMMLSVCLSDKSHVFSILFHAFSTALPVVTAVWVQRSAILEPGSCWVSRDIPRWLHSCLSRRRLQWVALAISWSPLAAAALGWKWLPLWKSLSGEANSIQLISGSWASNQLMKYNKWVHNLHAISLLLNN